MRDALLTLTLASASPAPAEPTATTSAEPTASAASMDETSKALAPQGAPPTTCTDDRLTIRNPQAKLEFERA